MGVDALDGVRVPYAGVLGPGRVLLLRQHVALHQTDDRRTGLGVEDVTQVPDGVVGGERAAAPPAHVLADMQRPGPQVVARFPTFQQERAGQVVVAGAGQVLADLAAQVGLRVPLEGVGILEREQLGADAQVAALRHCRRGAADRRLARHPADESVSGAGGKAEQRCRAQEVAAVDAAFGEVFLESGKVWMLAAFLNGFSSRQSRPRPRQPPGNPRDVVMVVCCRR